MTVDIYPGVTIGQGILISPAPIITNRPPLGVVAQGAAQVSTTRSLFGTGSYTSNGTNGSLKVTPATGFAFGSGPFTVEFSLYLTNVSISQAFYGSRPNNTDGPYQTIYLNTGATVAYYVNNSNKIVSSISLTANTWNSVAVVRSGTTTTMYINGVACGSFTDTTVYQSGPSAYFFGDDFYAGSGYPLIGYADEIRVSNVARYTGNYTPANGPFISDINTIVLIHCNGTNGSTVFGDAATGTYTVV